MCVESIFKRVILAWYLCVAVVAVDILVPSSSVRKQEWLECVLCVCCPSVCRRCDLPGSIYNIGACRICTIPARLTALHIQQTICTLRSCMHVCRFGIITVNNCGFQRTYKIMFVKSVEFYLQQLILACASCNRIFTFKLSDHFVYIHFYTCCYTLYARIVECLFAPKVLDNIYMIQIRTDNAIYK